MNRKPPLAILGAGPTGHELTDRIFQPLAGGPGIAPHLQLGTRVEALGRQGLLKNQAIGDPVRKQHRFRLLVRNSRGESRTVLADVVLDCTGTYGQPSPTGDGGFPAPGEELFDHRIVRTIPDFAANPGPWAGNRILLVGAGHSAQTAVTDLAALAEDNPGTSVAWAMRRDQAEWPLADGDPLPRARPTDPMCPGSRSGRLRPCSLSDRCCRRFHRREERSHERHAPSS